MEWYENFNLEEIVTPVNAQVFNRLLKQSNYDDNKRQYLVNGFTEGFDLEFEGDREVRRFAPNLKITIGSKEEIWEKMMKEVKGGRYAGPFKEPPFKHFIQSPIGLVPKDGGKKTRLIFHLSYPRIGNSSVNKGIPRDACKVKYPDFDEAVQMCVRAGKDCHVGKSDVSMAFRNVPLKVKDFPLLVMKAEHPITKYITL